MSFIKLFHNILDINNEVTGKLQLLCKCKQESTLSPLISSTFYNESSKNYVKGRKRKIFVVLAVN